jgi:hypothetical protein
VEKETDKWMTTSQVNEGKKRTLTKIERKKIIENNIKTEQ